MKKIETVWCQLLFESLEKQETHFQQQKLAANLNISTSTVHHGLKDLRRMGAVRVGGDGGSVIDAEKILLHWANHRALASDVIKQLSLNGSVLEIEGLLPTGSILGAYSAVRLWYGEPPADYTSVYVYHPQPEQIIRRFANHPPGDTTLTILKLPATIPLRAETTTLAHTFVDLWNLTDWMAKDFVRRVREEIDGILS
ncbi:MAG: hypothetical protein UV61_C0013G0011 [Candidatus Gottesmanbacteria bacterium GW2011_GWB1_43_11]|uniref:Helix-turn-helix type 11 domain-containing protein n=1 Tax=Candidatus Gottesmanbacteria bacterium GW2011_GWB1_43_11 TaxID=1618446 RepID=A0A0G1ESM4_9BACT|nr:MAG: hypothetical protein UV17_C0029G0011 [Candidatus Gottesmanbacteria bacterium GW2011_GWA1_42_26]KKS80534.1 MAG: hypothetical protein UV55_C0036G0003 [Candidatus Gottesmanbacteria bacterium GW2011_GWC1_43_10]KKS86076.1 MAG: hypothetical protein UV61_C0013G0011 [Candidatus Gottesmanbacteria bacterium GW2011_GWB1_43_11]OGG09818.1 MAG: hypothetical protein A2699_02700 [Candidatus Gottesmanbacteria bacterium RIFCSPHIGHO2_01_FULL_43_15]HCM37149.1 hypothetical protein [Patescibacteria group bac